MGKGGGQNEAAQTQSRLSENLYNETSGVRQGALGQGQEILNSGGASMLIPIIAKALEGSKMALSKTLTDMDGRMGRMAGTPFGQRIRAQTQLQGEQQNASIAPTMNMDLFSKILGFAGNQTQTAIGGLGQAAGAESTRIASENDAYARIMSAAMPKTSFGMNVGGA